MTKAVLVEEVAQVADLTKKHAEVIVETVFRSIIDALHRGEKIELRGFGSFRLRQREPRKGRNPKTGDRVDVPPKRVPYFKPGKELKELINREPDRASPPLAPVGPDENHGAVGTGRSLPGAVAGPGTAFTPDRIDRESEPPSPLRGVRQPLGLRRQVSPR
jgi:integration host factor subunit beta